MKEIFLESHNIKNMHFGFGQFNYHLLNAIFNQKVNDIKFTIHANRSNPVLKKFGDFYKIKDYNSLSRYPLFRMRKKYNLWHSLNQNTKIEPYHDLPYLLTVHNISFIKDYADYTSNKNHIRFQDKLNRSQAITYISNYAKESTHQFFDVPSVDEHVVYNGNPILEINLTDNYVPKLMLKEPFLFSIGEFSDRKNFQSLIPMMLELKDFKLVIAGKKSTENGEKVQQLINKYRLNDRVILAGKISELDKQYYYKHCLAFVFPSLREGFGLPVIEAMKFGKPVFISNNTSLPEVGGQYAFYWDNYDPLEMAKILEQGMDKFLNNKAEFELAYIKRAESFNWDSSAKSYISIYYSLLNN